MSAIQIVAFGAVSALGEGRQAVNAGEVGAAAQAAIVRDDALARAGLRRPFVARAARSSGNDDRIDSLLTTALSSCSCELDRVRPGWRNERVGLILGTSSGGMRAAENAFAALARNEPVLDVEAPTYFGPLARAARRLGCPLDPCVLVLGACASSTIAIDRKSVV